MIKRIALYSGLFFAALITLLLSSGAYVITWGKPSVASHIIEITGLDKADTVSASTPDTKQKRNQNTLRLEPRNQQQTLTLHTAKFDRPVNIKTNLHDQNLDIMIEGLKPFVPVEIVQGQTSVKAKTDWVGQYRAEGLIFYDQGSPDDNTVKLALNQGLMAKDHREDSLLIKILEAPYGGGPDSAGVNDYTNTYCGDPVLSVCVTNRMRKQIQGIIDNYDTALIMMGEQLSAVQSQYVGIVGGFFDAKQQLETQRTHQRLLAQAHKDYHPSEQMCRFGSFIKSVAKTEEKMLHTQQAINKIMMDTYTAKPYSSTSLAYASDIHARLKQFREVYCDVTDNHRGLAPLCGTGGSDRSRLNKDINFSRVMEFPLTLDINFLDSTPTANEEDIMALARNLYWFKPLPVMQPEIANKEGALYLKARRLMAMQNVAHNSFAHAVAEKSQAPPSQESGSAYMKALMREFGLNDNEINELLGDNPSYYAQMDVLAKKIYQSPHFYTNLYDKPVNIDRISTALEAIKLMQMRDMHAASLRREMLTSVLVENGLEKHAADAQKKIDTQMGKRAFFAPGP